MVSYVIILWRDTNACVALNTPVTSPASKYIWMFEICVRSQLYFRFCAKKNFFFWRSYCLWSNQLGHRLIKTTNNYKTFGRIFYARPYEAICAISPMACVLGSFFNICVWSMCITNIKIAHILLHIKTVWYSYRR